MTTSQQRAEEIVIKLKGSRCQECVDSVAFVLNQSRQEGIAEGVKLVQEAHAKGHTKGFNAAVEKCASLAEDKFRDGYSAFDSIKAIRNLKVNKCQTHYIKT